MDKIRGIVLVVLGILALYHGSTMHPSHSAILAYALGGFSIAIGIWRLSQKPPPRQHP